MKKRRYEIYDVFTDTALTGNPLAVVLEAEGLDDKAMQAIAGEFNLSETIFISPPQTQAHSAAVRIFTPRTELPFAGHPTVGAAICLYEREGGERGPSGAAILVLEEKIGAVRCVVSDHGGRPAFAEFDLPRLPTPIPLSAEPELVAAALGLDAQDIDLENHRPSAWSAGVPFVCVPVRGLNAAARVRVNTEMWMEVAPPAGDVIASAYVYCRETVHEDTAFHARMFAPHDGIMEDPATGSAAAAFAGAILAFDSPVDGPNRYWIEQGVEMGRPSRIRLELDVAQKSLKAARIGGHAVKVAEGVLLA